MERHSYLTERAREYIVGTAISALGTSHSLSLIPPGQGIVDLDRAIAAGYDVVPQGSYDGGFPLIVDTATWATREQLFRASGSQSANPFAPLRGMVRRLPLGLRQLGASNALAVLAESTANARASLAVPAFSGDNCDAPPDQYAGAFGLGVAAAALNTAADAAATLTIEAVDACTVSLDDLVIQAQRTAFNAADAAAEDYAPGVTVTALTLPDRTPMVIGGQGVTTPEVPASIWCGCRPRNMVKLGWVAMSSGDQIVIGLVNRSGLPLDLTAWVPAYAKDSCKPKVYVPKVPATCKV